MPSCDFGASKEECGCRDCRDSPTYQEPIISMSFESYNKMLVDRVKAEQELIKLKSMIWKQKDTINALRKEISSMHHEMDELKYQLSK